MKTFSEIYNSIKTKFFNKTGLDIQSGTVIDNFLIASAYELEDAHKEIANNKNPHLYTELSGNDLDKMGYGLQLQRLVGEVDDAYFFRLINWMYSAQSGNIIAIQAALTAMIYASSVIYVTKTHGASTATAYIIPVSYDGNTPENAIEETKTRLKNVVSPTAEIDYIIPNIIPIKFSIYLSTKDSNINQIQSLIESQVKTYVDSIPVGSYLELGEINKIGILTNGVEYFNVTQTYINDVESSNIEFLQTIDSKFLFSEIVWWTVNN